MPLNKAGSKAARLPQGVELVCLEFRRPWYLGLARRWSFWVFGWVFGEISKIIQSWLANLSPQIEKTKPALTEGEWSRQATWNSNGFFFRSEKVFVFFRALNAPIENKWVPGTWRRQRFIAFFFSVGIGLGSTSKCPEFCWFVSNLGHRKCGHCSQPEVWTFLFGIIEKIIHHTVIRCMIHIHTYTYTMCCFLWMSCMQKKTLACSRILAYLFLQDQMPDFVNLIAPRSERNRTRECHSGVGWGLGFIKVGEIFMWLVCSYPVVDFCHGSEFENPTKEIGFKGFMLWRVSAKPRQRRNWLKSNVRMSIRP